MKSVSVIDAVTEPVLAEKSIGRQRRPPTSTASGAKAHATCALDQ